MNKRETEAKAWFSYENAKANFSGRGAVEGRRHLAAMTAASNAASGEATKPPESCRSIASSPAPKKPGRASSTSTMTMSSRGEPTGAVFGVLIVVSVTMDTINQVQSHLLAHQYEGLIEKSNLRGKKRPASKAPARR